MLISPFKIILGAVKISDLLDTQFPDGSSVGTSKKRSDKIEIDLNDLLAQGVRRRQDKEVKKQEQKERRKCSKKGTARPEDPLQIKRNSEVNEEARVDE